MDKLQRLLQNKILILTICAAGIGGTFQYGYNISIINAPASYIQVFMNTTWLERMGVPLESNMVLLLWSFTVSAYPLGGLAGAVAAGPMAIMLGRELLGGEESWPFLLASNVVPALIQLTALPWFPESPRYLLIDRGDKESCISGEFRVTISSCETWAPTFLEWCHKFYM
uniref:Uncharacterized protein n=1 Tax=Junco hyemalis TaxID=40217 RepID=A0A8C5IT29_JUNHY